MYKANIRKFLAAAAMALLGMTAALAQVKVSGTVSDELGPLAGAGVV